MIHRRVLALLLIAICATLPALAIANKVGDASVANEPEPSSWGVSNVIEHIIVLMMENRSFDHLLGWLHEDYNSALEGLTPAFKQPRDPKDPSKGFLPVTRGGYDVGPDDPHHTFEATHMQMDGTNMDGFVENAIRAGHNETNPVSMFDSKSAPIINMLAREYAVFDHWYSSVPGPTDPNRAFAMSGTCRGNLDNYNGTRWQMRSFFDVVRSYNRTFGAYYQDNLWVYGHYEDMHKPENMANIHEIDTFMQHAASGNLPQFSWIQPRITTVAGKLPTWQHPDASILEGERYIKQIYEAVRASPAWNKTLLLITYDEHGGFYDHISPPADGIPTPDGIRAPNGFNFDRLGIRVPTIAISPWIQKNTIVSGPFPMEKPTPTSEFDSTSIMATAHHLLGLREAGAPMLGARTKWANTFVGLLHQRSQSEGPRTDCPKYLPALPEVEDMEAAVAIQRSKPLNEHLISELTFYCFEHYDGLDNCPGHPELKYNQGLASDWILDETDKFFERHGRITNRRREKLLQEMK